MASQNALRDQNNVPSLLLENASVAGEIVRAQGDQATGRLLVDNAGGGAGTVTSVSVVTANGFAGTVANASSTPAITLTTTINSPVLAGDGTSITAATTTGSGSTAMLNDAPTIINTLTVGAASGATGKVDFKGTTSGTVSLSVADAAGTWTMKLPTTAGTNGYFLKTDGSGNTSWDTGPAASLTVGTTAISNGTDTRVLYNNAGTLGEYTVTGTGDVVLNNSPTFVDDVTIGTPSTATGSILFKGTTSGTVTLSVLDAAGTWTMKLPDTGGTNGYVLSTDGSGNTSWVAQTGGSGGAGNAYAWFIS